MAELQDLDGLEEKSVYILREAKARFKNLAALWSMGKDSTAMLAIARKAFFGRVPFPVIHIDNGIDFPETYEFRKKLSDEWGMELIVAKSEIKDDLSGIRCCGANKTDALRKLLDDRGFDGLIVSIRRDEHGIRAKERTFSPRDKDFKWNYKEQPPEIWDFTSKFEDSSHVRIHPILQWNEIDIWRYVKRESIPGEQPLFLEGGQKIPQPRLHAVHGVCGIKGRIGGRHHRGTAGDGYGRALGQDAGQGAGERDAAPPSPWVHVNAGTPYAE